MWIVLIYIFLNFNIDIVRLIIFFFYCLNYILCRERERGNYVDMNMYNVSYQNILLKWMGWVNDKV